MGEELCFMCEKSAEDGVMLDAYGLTGKSVCLPCVGRLAAAHYSRPKEVCPSVLDLRPVNTTFTASATRAAHVDAYGNWTSNWSAGEEQTMRDVLRVIRQGMQNRLNRPGR